MGLQIPEIALLDECSWLTLPACLNLVGHLINHSGFGFHFATSVPSAGQRFCWIPHAKQELPPCGTMASNSRLDLGDAPFSRDLALTGTISIRENSRS
jgi:hypothetical protein